MKKLSPRNRLIAAGITVVIVFAALCISAAVFGAWWRYPNMPTADEWQALFGASVLVALALTWLQIRQVESSNRQLIDANELARRANLEISRPRVQVLLQADRQVFKDRSADVRGTMYISIRNIGQSPARNVRLTVDVPFTSMEKFFNPGMMTQHFSEINAVFDGSVRFPVLNAESGNYVWFLGRVPELFNAPATVPRRYTVSASYESTGGESYSEETILDLDIEKRVELAAPPLARIAKDIQVVGEVLKNVRTDMRTARQNEAATRVDERERADSVQAQARKLGLRGRRPRIRRIR